MAEFGDDYKDEENEEDDREEAMREYVDDMLRLSPLLSRQRHIQEMTEQAELDRRLACFRQLYDLHSFPSRVLLEQLLLHLSLCSMALHVYGGEASVWTVAINNQDQAKSLCEVKRDESIQITSLDALCAKTADLELSPRVAYAAVRAWNAGRGFAPKTRVDIYDTDKPTTLAEAFAESAAKLSQLLAAAPRRRLGPSTNVPDGWKEVRLGFDKDDEVELPQPTDLKP